MKMNGTCATICATALALCLALAGCGAGSSRSSEAEKQPKVTITKMDPDEEEESKRGSSKRTKESDHDVLSTCLGTISKRFADDHGNPLVEKNVARDIFAFTIEGEDFELPCPINTFLEKGWQLEQGYIYDDNMKYDPGFSYDIGMWHEGDANYNIMVKLRNVSNEVVPWKNLTVVGLTIRPVDSFVAFESKIGIDRDSDLDKLLTVFGCNDESALLENKTIVEYHVSLLESMMYDMHATVYGNVTYDWNKVGKVATSLSFELVDPWDKDLRKTEEQLAEERAKREEEGDFSDSVPVGYDVGRTVEGTKR